MAISATRISSCWVLEYVYVNFGGFCVRLDSSLTTSFDALSTVVRRYALVFAIHQQNDGGAITKKRLRRGDGYSGNSRESLEGSVLYVMFSRYRKKLCMTNQILQRERRKYVRATSTRDARRKLALLLVSALPHLKRCRLSLPTMFLSDRPSPIFGPGPKEITNEDTHIRLTAFRKQRPRFGDEAARPVRWQSENTLIDASLGTPNHHS